MFDWFIKLLRTGANSQKSFVRVAPKDSKFEDVHFEQCHPRPHQLTEKFLGGQIDPLIYYQFVEDNDDTGFVHKMKFFGVNAANQNHLYTLYHRQLASLQFALVIGEDDFLNPILVGLKDGVWSVYRLDLEINDLFEIATDVACFFSELKAYP